MNVDILTLQGLVLETRIGVYDWEKVARQYLVLDIVLEVDRSLIIRASASDNVKDALDYMVVVERIRQIAAESTCQLLETFAERLADILLAEFALQKLTLSVQKPAALASVDSAGLTIERSRTC